MKCIPIALSALLGLSAVAVHAQEPWTEIEDEAVVAEPLGLTVGELSGAPVYGPTGDRIGEIDDILIGQDGSSMAASIDVGGFLGIGEKDVVLPLENLTNAADGGVAIDLTDEQLEALPEYEG